MAVIEYEGKVKSGGYVKYNIAQVVNNSLKSTIFSISRQVTINPFNSMSWSKCFRRTHIRLRIIRLKSWRINEVFCFLSSSMLNCSSRDLNMSRIDFNDDKLSLEINRINSTVNKLNDLTSKVKNKENQVSQNIPKLKTTI